MRTAGAILLGTVQSQWNTSLKIRTFNPESHSHTADTALKRKVNKPISQIIYAQQVNTKRNVTGSLAGIV